MNEYNPYVAPSALVEELPGPVSFELADRWMRLVSALVENVILMAVIMGPILVGIALMASGEGSDRGWMWIFPAFAWAGLAGLGYLGLTLWWLYKYQQSIGKRIFGMRIVRSDGSPADFGRLFGLRMVVPWLCSQVPFVGAIFALVNICFIFREDRRCIHDLMADTIVVKV